MDKFKDYTIDDLLKSFELLVRQSKTRFFLNKPSKKLDVEIEECKTEILRRCSLG